MSNRPSITTTIDNSPFSASNCEVNTYLHKKCRIINEISKNEYFVSLYRNGISTTITNSPFLASNCEVNKYLHKKCRIINERNTK